ncbi:hypothetical protein CSUI_010579 [Cystoisospora suis]|uniref:Uncharacterized protein n=1 Tax=Cystoisospora suis TaxID=483139 RepID=A0A2C6KGU2_9APIC|nr:hypothetical protein CSUI_010579 [Cystoisospora suis]
MSRLPGDSSQEERRVQTADLRGGIRESWRKQSERSRDDHRGTRRSLSQDSTEDGAAAAAATRDAYTLERMRRVEAYHRQVLYEENRKRATKI